jgi:MFS family permease
MSEPAVTRATFLDVLRVPEFRGIWLADAQSNAGDQLSRVALSVLVFQRTDSAAVTALVYALTFLPAIAGGALLSGLADRLPRRSLMIWCDLLRAGLLAVMAIPALPLAVVCTLLVVSILAGRPFAAAETALVPEILHGESYVVGSGLRMMTGQIAQLVGFAVGGVAVGFLGAHASLGVDALTFLLSALIVRLTVRQRPAIRATVLAATESVWRSMSTSMRLIATDRRLRALVGLGWLAAFHVVPEGIAPPYAAAVGGSSTAVGLLMAAGPAGSAIGAFLFVRVPERIRVWLVGPLAIATGLPLMACALHPGLTASIALWAISGLFGGYQVQAAASFVRATPESHRGQTIGLVTSGLVAIQGVGILAFGGVAGGVGAAEAVGLAGAIAVALAIVLTVSWTRTLVQPNLGEPERQTAMS